MTSAIEQIYDKAIITSELPSCARVRLRESTEERFLALHVMYAPPVNRGNVCLLPDFPRLYDVSVSIKTDKDIIRVISAPDGEKLRFEKGDGRVTVYLDPFRLHKLVLLEW